MFLGGAVLANIVRQYRYDPFSTLSVLTHKTDGRQGGHVDLQARMARARAAYIRKVREEIDQGYVLSHSSFSKSFMDLAPSTKHSKSILSFFNVTREKMR